MHYRCFVILTFLFSFLNQCHKCCPLKCFDFAHCQRFGSAVSPPPAFYLWHHLCSIMAKAPLSNNNTRNMKNLHVQKLKLDHAKRSILYTAPKAWSSIPHAIGNAEAIARFKKRVQTSHFQLKDTIVALICTNPLKTSNKLRLIVVHLLFFCSMVA